MARICSQHQPSYLPWPPFFGKMAACDVWIHVDDISFSNKGVQERHKIKGPNGAFWLTVPVQHKHKLDEPIHSIQIDKKAFLRSKHLKNIESNYVKAPYFSNYIDQLKHIYITDWDNLVDLNIALLDFFCINLDIRCERILSSPIGIETKRSQRIIDLCKSVRANVFLSGSGGIRYMDMDLFKKAGIEVIFQLPKITEYPQLWPKVGFIPGLSALDLLLNLGPDAAEYVRNCFELVDEATLRSRMNEVPHFIKSAIYDEQNDDL